MEKKCISHLCKKNNSEYNSRNYNDLYRSFSKEFQLFFNSIDDREWILSHYYVPNKKMEEALYEFRNSPSNSTTIIIGNKGSGKSTVIQHFFSIDLYREVVKIDFSKKELIFNVKLGDIAEDDIKKKDSMVILQLLNELSAFLLETFPETRNTLSRIGGKKEIIDCIKKDYPYIIADPSLILFDGEKTDWNNSALRFAKNNFRNAYFISLLKCILKSHADEIHNLIIIIDGLESFTYDIQQKIILSILRFKEAMLSYKFEKTINIQNHFVKLLIALRPYTARALIGDTDIRFSSSWVIKYVNNEDLDLFPLFKKRFDYILHHEIENISKIERYKDTYKVLMSLGKELNHYSRLIKNICLYNTAWSLSVFAEILTNRYYIQNNAIRKSFITCSREQFIINDYSVIRAISCGENYYFSGESLFTAIPNIFFTSINDDYSVECLLVMQYYSTHYNNYGISAEMFSTTLSNWKTVFGDSITTRLCQAMNYLYKKKVLRKLDMDADASVCLDDIELINDSTYFYISTMGNQILELLDRDSLALELFREAAWREYSGKKYSDLPSSKLLQASLSEESQQNVLFIDLLEYISYFSDCESCILKILEQKKTTDKYISLFGLNTVSSRLLHGVNNAITVSNIYKVHPELRINYDETLRKVLALMRFIDKSEIKSF